MEMHLINNNMIEKEIIKTLNDFVPSEYESENVDFLYNLTDKMESFDNKQIFLEPILTFLEKHPDREFGTPGPLVSFIEIWCNNYENSLTDSIDRQPVTSNIDMLKAVFNSLMNDIQNCVETFDKALKHPNISEYNKEIILDFLKTKGVKCNDKT